MESRPASRPGGFFLVLRSATRRLKVGHSQIKKPLLISKIEFSGIGVLRTYIQTRAGPPPAYLSETVPEPPSWGRFPLGARGGRFSTLNVGLVITVTGGWFGAACMGLSVC